MFNKIRIKSFKSFGNLSIDAGGLTILTGLNNSGKSSVIQALRMCYVAAKSNFPYLDGFGGYADLKSTLTKIEDNIEISLCSNDETKFDLKFNVDSCTVEKLSGLPIMQYISADRYGPRVSLPLMSDDIDSLSVGALGQYAAHYAQIFENTLVNEKLRHQNSQSNTLRHQLIKWMGEISPGVKLDFDVSKKYDTSSLGVDGNRPTNSGFGISYTLPIVLAILTMTGENGNDEPDKRLGDWFSKIKNGGGLLLLENPEAHLHPRGQTEIGKLIAMAAACGLKLIVETHSDHLLDGIRIAVKDRVGILPEEVKIHFFSKEESLGTITDEIALKSDGKLDHWPRGFFDQYSQNLRALAKRNE